MRWFHRSFKKKLNKLAKTDNSDAIKHLYKTLKTNISEKFYDINNNLLSAILIQTQWNFKRKYFVLNNGDETGPSPFKRSTASLMEAEDKEQPSTSMACRTTLQNEVLLDSRDEESNSISDANSKFKNLLK